MVEKEIEEMREILKIRNRRNISRSDIVEKINKLIIDLEGIKEASGVEKDGMYLEILDNGNLEVGIRIPEFVLEDKVGLK